jgi:Kef-type K+ transport system membrane component KefB
VDTLFAQVAMALVLAVALGVVANALRQPLLIAFIVAGILAGPDVLGVIEDPVELSLLAKIGISVLLFLVGLRLDVRHVREIGPVAVATGLGQVLFTSGLGYLLALLLGFAPVTALYVAVALTFSSTIIIVKLLSDKGEVDDLHGRIAIGFLIVQDIAVVVAMIVLTAVDTATGTHPIQQVLEVMLRGAVLLGGLAALMRWVLPAVVHRMARQSELLVLFAIAWAVGLASVTLWLGFSEEIGAFLAGVALASTSYREAIGGRLVSLRDFLLLFFFLDLGSTLELQLAGGQVVAAVVLSLFVLIGNPLIVMAIMGAMGYRKRVSFLAGLTVAQISEFSLILAALGQELGYIGDDTVGLITTVGVITITASTYLITYSHQLFDRLEPFLGIFERKQPSEGPRRPATMSPDVVVIGVGRFGRELVTELRALRLTVMGVDFDPVSVRAWAGDDEIEVVYGDAEDPELPAALPLRDVRWVVSTIRGLDANLAVVRHFRDIGFAGAIGVVARSDADADQLRRAGADRTVSLFRAAAQPFITEIATSVDTRADEPAGPPT